MLQIIETIRYDELVEMLNKLVQQNKMTVEVANTTLQLILKSQNIHTNPRNLLFDLDELNKLFAINNLVSDISSLKL